MELLEVLRKRRAVREYTDVSIERSVVQRIISSAIFAPSAINAQPWVFAVILDRIRIEEYGQRAKHWSLSNFAQARFTPELRTMLEDPNLAIFYHAPALVMVIARTAETQAAEDCCLVAENFMLAARDEALGTCWIGLARPWLNLAATKAELSLPNEYRVIAPIVLGHPKFWPESVGRNPAEIYWLG